MTINTKSSHIPVLKNAAVDALNLTDNDCVIDATFGHGGHSDIIMSNLSKHSRLIVIDQDPTAINVARTKWEHETRVKIIHAPFSHLSKILDSYDLLGKVTAILFDFGVSSPQLDNRERGFSFMHDGPLDMRMDQTKGVSAALWLKHVEEKELAYVLKRYGEERFAKRIAQKIKETLRKNCITTTRHLAELVEKAVPKTEKNKHPATRTFQAIRIVINNELAEIEAVLPQVLEALAPGGRVVIISFHSLEDRLVKLFFKQQSKGDPYPIDLPVTKNMLKPKLRLVGKPLKADKIELDENRRARSAVMRIAEKIA